MPLRVNLDAIVRRENFQVLAQTIGAQGEEDPKLKVSELEKDSLFFKHLRKPDFQRRTAHWTPVKVAGLITSFLSGDLIPALILWPSQSSPSIFVIDGAHRLSALIAWVHNDYGDGGLSRAGGNLITDEQLEAADETRKIVLATIGSYDTLKLTPPDTDQRQKFAYNLSKNGVTLQWVKGSAEVAERSFHTINSEQSPIGDLEKRLIRDRRCPNAIATRALINAGTGLHLASSFPDSNKDKIQQLAGDVYKDLFTPRLDPPIKTLDLPVAGSSYSDETVKVVLDVIEFVNKPKIDQAKPKKKTRRPKGSPIDMLTPTMEEDADGLRTIEFLSTFKKISARIAGANQSSLGLHPAVYFYSATGKYQPTAFLSAISLITELVEQDGLIAFCDARNDFEELLLKYKFLINEIARRFGSGSRGLAALLRLQKYLLAGAQAKKADTEIFPEALRDDRLSFLRKVVDFDKGINPDFTRDKKSAAFLKQALDGAVRCSICNARVHLKSLNVEHEKAKRDGGRGSDDNAQIAHPYCNSTYKDYLAKRGSIG